MASRPITAATVDERVDRLVGRVDDLEARFAIYTGTMQRVEKTSEKILRAIGEEGLDEYGKPIGSGLVGRMMRLERRVDRRFNLYDGWKRALMAAVGGASLVGGVLWWAIGDKVGAVLK